MTRGLWLDETGEAMEQDIRKVIARLDEAVRVFATAVKEERLSVARVGPKKLIFVCANCEGVYRRAPDGLRCAGCGQAIPVRWPDGTMPSLEELRRYALRLEGKD